MIEDVIIGSEYKDNSGKYSKVIVTCKTKTSIQFKDQKGYICSELMCELLEDLGIKFCKPKHLIKPIDIITALELYGKTQ